VAAEQADEADEAFGGTLARMEVPPHARAVWDGRGHRFAAHMEGPPVKPYQRVVVRYCCTSLGVGDDGRGGTLRRRVILICAGCFRRAA
jgi:hypothetical protein